MSRLRHLIGSLIQAWSIIMDRYRYWILNINKANMNNIKVYQVRVSFKSIKPFVKIQPASHTGIVMAKNKREAEAKAIEVSSRAVDETILVTATSKSLPSTFILSTF